MFNESIMILIILWFAIFYLQQVVVILVGTNNTEDLPANIVAGLLELTKLVQSKLPNSDIILLELLPRGRNMNKLWEKNITTNAALQAALASNPLGPKVHLHRHKEEDFVINGNQISTADFFDYLHLSESGNRKVFTPVYERIKKILTELDKVGDVLWRVDDYIFVLGFFVREECVVGLC